MEKLLIDTKELRELTNLGKPNAVRLGDAAGARVMIGDSLRWNIEKIKKYINKVAQ